MLVHFQKAVVIRLRSTCLPCHVLFFIREMGIADRSRTLVNDHEGCPEGRVCLLWLAFVDQH